MTTEPAALPGIVDDRELLPDVSAEVQGRTQLQIVWRRFRRHRVGLIASIALAILIALVILHPMFSPFGVGISDEEGTSNLAPSWPHIFGTGDLGEDIFTQVTYGGRASLLVGAVTATIATAFGAILGAIAGYAGGWVDSVISRVTDVFLTLPGLPALAALALVIGKLNILTITFVLAVLSWMGVTRLVRAEVISLKERDFVQAAKATGVPPWRIIWRHILPGAIPVIVVSATLLMGTAIILEATLSFLGIGLDIISNPSWGNIINSGRDGALLGHWWGVLFPGMAIVVTVLCVSFLGDALRDALDPYGAQSSGTGRQKEQNAAVRPFEEAMEGLEVQDRSRTHGVG